MKVMIAGAGSVGRSIAAELIQRGYEVTLVDSDPHAMRIAKVPSADWVLADACEIATLENISLQDADVVVAATGDDKANLVVSLLAKTEFGVPRVVARVNNPANEWLFDEAWGVDYAVSTPRIMTMNIEDAVASGELSKRIDFDQSSTSLYQAVIPADAPIVGLAIREILLPQSLFICGIIRGGAPLIAEPLVKIESEDRVLFIAHNASEEEIAAVAALSSPPTPLSADSAEENAN